MRAYPGVGTAIASMRVELCEETGSSVMGDRNPASIAAHSSYDGFVPHLARPVPPHQSTATRTSSTPTSDDANLRRTTDGDDHLRPETLLDGFLSSMPSWRCSSIRTGSSSPEKGTQGKGFLQRFKLSKIFRYNI